MTHKTRQHDLEQLRNEYQRETDPNIRRQIEEAGRRIARETGAMESMRERLIKEHRKSRWDNVRDIVDSINNNPKYYQGKHE